MTEQSSLPLWHQALVELPKAHLHVHLEGSLSDDWVARQGVPPFEPLAIGDFSTFIARYQDVTRLVTYGEEPLRSAFVDLMHTEQQLGSRWVEVTVDPFLHSPRLGNPVEVLELMAEAVTYAATRVGIEAGLVVAVDRTCDLLQAQQTVAAAHAVASHCRAVVAVGIANDERQGPLSVYADVLSTSQLPLVLHAGELLGADEVVFAAQTLGARRIGHATSATTDAAIATMTATGVGVEACITSNELLEVVAAERHPLRRWMDAGVTVSLHADDPGLMGTNLVAEYDRARQLFGLTTDDIATLAVNGWMTACAPESLRDAMVVSVEAWRKRWSATLD